MARTFLDPDTEARRWAHAADWPRRVSRPSEPSRRRMLPLRTTARRAPVREVLVLVLAVAALTTVEALLGAQAYPDDAIGIAAYPMIGFAFVAVGALAWSRRPVNGTGALLVVAGLLVLGADLQNIDQPALIAIGLLLGQTPIAAALHLTLAFPAGRVTHPVDRVLVVAGYALVVLVEVPVAFPTLAPLAVADDAVLALRVALFTVAGVRALTRAVRDTPRGSSERHVLFAVALFGGLLQLFFVVTARVLKPLLDMDPYQLFVIQISVFAVTPFVYAAGVLLGGFGRTGELAELGAWLGSRGTERVSLRDALASVLGDPSLEIVFTRPGSGVLIDADGHPVDVWTTPTRGAVSVPGVDGRTPSATLLYDTTLIADPGVVEQAGRVVSLALERERLDAELLAEREALRASRARIVEVGDLNRRQLAQDLHDVLQSRLTLAALHAGRLAVASSEDRTRQGAGQLRDELDRLITEFRAVVHGVMPALLVERGLAAAAEDLVDRQPIPARLRLVGAERLSQNLATTAYFILAEALTNAVRHASATALEVSVVEGDDELVIEVRDDGVGGAATRSGAGLRGIADRVGAYEGRFSVESPPGGGTRLTVVLPCAS